MIRQLLKQVAKVSAAESIVFGIAKALGRFSRVAQTPQSQFREIDAVYLWVNDQDANWQSKRALYRPIGETAVAASKSRFRQFNELLTSIRLLSVNAPFIRKVFIVVDDQAPKLDSITGNLPFEIILVNHSEFIPAEVLPTFNSRAITAHLHLIPGLSERFLYLNDDVFVARPSQIEDWFEGNKLVVRFTETRFPSIETLAENEVLYRARWKALHLAKEKGWVVDDRMPEHAPYPLTKSIMKKLWQEFPEALAETAQSKFRTAEAILPELLAFYLAAGSQLSLPAKNQSYKYVPMNEASAIMPLLDLALKPGRFLTICLNDVSEVAEGNRISEKALAKRYARTLRFLGSTATV